jgi:hypothetical protein
MKKASTKLALLVLGAASLNAALTLPASAQAKPSSSQTCDNKSTARDKVQRPDARCVNVTSEKYTDERAFLQAHEVTSRKVISKREEIPGGYHIWNDTVIITGPGYRFVNGVGSGLASGIGTSAGNGGSGGGRGRTSAR